MQKLKLLVLIAFQCLVYSKSFALVPAPWRPEGSDYPFMRRAVLVNYAGGIMGLLADHPLSPFGPRMGYYMGHGQILLPITEIIPVNPVTIQTFDGQEYALEKDDYEIGLNLQDGFHFQLTQYSKLILEPNRRIGILRITHPSIRTMDTLPSAEVDFKSSISSQVWAVGAFFNSSAGGDTDEAGETGKSKEKPASRDNPKAILTYLDSNVRSDENGAFQLKPLLSSVEEGKVGLAPGAPIFTQSVGQIAGQSASLYALYDGNVDDRFANKQHRLPPDTLKNLVYTGTRSFRMAVLSALLKKDHVLIPTQFWENYVKNLANVAGSYNRVLHVEMSMLRVFQPFMSADHARVLVRGMRNVALRTRDTSRRGWPEKSNDSFAQFYATVQSVAAKALQSEQTAQECVDKLSEEPKNPDSVEGADSGK